MGYSSFRGAIRSARRSKGSGSLTTWELFWPFLLVIGIVLGIIFLLCRH